MDFQGFTYVAGHTPVHRCDARAKIAILLAFSIAIFFVQSWCAMALFVAAVAVPAVVARIPVRQLVVPLVPVLVLAAFAVVFAAVNTPTPGGLLAGLLVAVRMVTLVAASLVVCLTTTSTALLKAFSQIIRPLRAVGVPVDDIALTLSLALRFIPVIADEFAAVRKAQIARGANLSGVSFRRKLRIWGAAFSAVFIGLFRRADALATALDARCYGAKGDGRRNYLSNCHSEGGQNQTTRPITETSSASSSSKSKMSDL